ncbi:MULTISPECIES: efflux RND transporter periplasmic adaptor subunit [Chryseobacterium]|uniref:efflux RND transporter periplasmic adaptor subunit n=1 Tax=Chryseobacterium TaxID=59732 RepID=UPI00195BDC0A|nr:MULTISPECIES: efflux RND transporter periplasmic adaptor subunit [Chryseobacterium]MBM7421333.1 membrane fusion protein (multidrug efflux system) [Chryseobacterium sp. JUb44]MDH6211294.1 membrane fusion protein (multidrug efflux system) [Chryseobacterium sp. BIGb0186]WSO09952.1 efflux RND transporter periplasmic adaptor subunit [Chryseobacterium scophthalmum]
MKYLSKNTILAALSAVLFASCGGNEAPKEAAQPYPVVEVENRDVQAYQTYPTSIQGINNNDVRAKIQGYISQVLVDEGQRVSKGQVMFRLETNSLSQNASAAQSGVSAARARVEAAQVEVNRLKPLVDQNIVSNVLLETAKVNLLQAQSELEQARANHRSITANVDYSVIRAPIDGVVGKINLRSGALVGPADQTPITTVSDVRELYAYFSMNEAEYMDFLYETAGNSLEEKLRNVPPVELMMANGRIYEEKGKIGAVTGQINPQTGSIQFRVSFPNQQRVLTNGNSGTIRIPKTYKNVLIIPETGIFEQQGKVFAFTVQSDTVKQTEIKQISRIDKLVLVESGLKQGDIVVASGVAKLRTGNVIKPTKTVTDSIINNIQPIF